MLVWNLTKIHLLPKIISQTLKVRFVTTILCLWAGLVHALLQLEGMAAKIWMVLAGELFCTVYHRKYSSIVRLIRRLPVL